MKLSRISFAAAAVAAFSACSSNTSTPAPSGASATGASGKAGSGASGAGGSSGSASAGTTGTTGTGSGATGASGNGGTGAGGSSGASGGAGTTGASGASGVSGGTGAGGTTGASGASGSTSGASGVAGSSGASGSAMDGGAGPDAGGGCAGLPLCADFETDTVGSAPNPSLWQLQTGCGNPSTTNTITVDSSQAHSGTKSVKVVADGTSTCGPTFYNSGIIGSLGANVYGRFFVRFSVPQPMEHSAFMALGFQPDGGLTTNYNADNLEMTSQYGIFVWNLSDTTLPDMAPGTSAPANTWLCFEFHTSGTGDLDTWLSSDGGAQGDPVPSMTYDPGTTAMQSGVNDHWASGTGKPSPFEFTNVSFGWVTFGGGAATVWFDDIALSSTRIGCN
jgi:hypothetical protein